MSPGAAARWSALRPCGLRCSAVKMCIFVQPNSTKQRSVGTCSYGAVGSSTFTLLEKRFIFPQSAPFIPCCKPCRPDDAVTRAARTAPRRELARDRNFLKELPPRGERPRAAGRAPGRRLCLHDGPSRGETSSWDVRAGRAGSCPSAAWGQATGEPPPHLVQPRLLDTPQARLTAPPSTAHPGWAGTPEGKCHPTGAPASRPPAPKTPRLGKAGGGFQSPDMVLTYNRDLHFAKSSAASERSPAG